MAVCHICYILVTIPSGYVTSGLPYRPEKTDAGSGKSVGRLGKNGKGMAKSLS